MTDQLFTRSAALLLLLFRSCLLIHSIDHELGLRSVFYPRAHRYVLYIVLCLISLGEIPIIPGHVEATQLALRQSLSGRSRYLINQKLQNQFLHYTHAVRPAPA